MADAESVEQPLEVAAKGLEAFAALGFGHALALRDLRAVHLDDPGPVVAARDVLGLCLSAERIGFAERFALGIVGATRAGRAIVVLRRIAFGGALVATYAFAYRSVWFSLVTLSAEKGERQQEGDQPVIAKHSPTLAQAPLLDCVRVLAGLGLLWSAALFVRHRAAADFAGAKARAVDAAAPSLPVGLPALLNSLLVPLAPVAAKPS